MRTWDIEIWGRPRGNFLERKPISQILMSHTSQICLHESDSHLRHFTHHFFSQGGSKVSSILLNNSFYLPRNFLRFNVRRQCFCNGTWRERSRSFSLSIRSLHSGRSHKWSPSSQISTGISGSLNRFWSHQLLLVGSVFCVIMRFAPIFNLSFEPALRGSKNLCS